jgi:hypothetical protein
MVAYSFNRMFIDPIVTGTKSQTIRADRKRHARAGEAVQLYTALRTKHCRLIGRAVCKSALRIRLDVECGRVEFSSGAAITEADEIEAFAMRDGFPNWKAMRQFWEIEHPKVPVFSGVLIMWGQFEAAA